MKLTKPRQFKQQGSTALPPGVTPRNRAPEQEAEPNLALPEGVTPRNPVRAEAIQAGRANQYLGPMQRLNMAWLETDEEREAVFRNAYPQGDIVLSPVTSEAMGFGGRRMWRPDPASPWSPIEPEQGEAFDWQGDIPNTALGRYGAAVSNQARMAGEMLTDVGEFFAPDGTNIALETVILATPQGRGFIGAGRGFLTRAARAAAVSGASGVGGQAIDQGVQYVTGQQRQDPISVLASLGVSGVTEAAGGALGEGAEGVVRGVRQRGLFRVPERAARAEERFREIAESIGVEIGLRPEQVSDSQILTALSGAAGKVFSTLSRNTDAQRRVLVQVLENAANTPPDRARELITSAFLDADRAYRSEVERLLSGDVSVTEAGRALQAGRMLYETRSREAVNALYDVARRQAGDNVRFDFSVADDALDAFESRYFREIPVTRTDAEGNIIEGATARVPNDELNRLQSVYDLIRNVDPERATVEDIRRIQQTLHDLSLAGPEGSRQVNAAARELRGILQDVLDNPVGVSGEAMGSWRRANSAARRRFETLEQTGMMEVARSDTPYQLGAQYATPGTRVDEIRQLRAAFMEAGEAGRTNWRRFQNGALQNLIADPERFVREFDQYNNEQLSALFTQEQISGLRRYRRGLGNLEQTGIRGASEAEAYGLGFVNSLMTGSRSGNVDATITMLQNRYGNDWQQSAPGRALRGGVMLHVLRTVRQEIGRDAERISPAAMRNIMQQIETRGLTEFLTPGDLALLQDVRGLTRLIEAAQADVGTAIAGRADVLSVLDRPVTAAVTLIPYATISRLLTSPTFQDLATGRGFNAAAPQTWTLGFLARLSDDVIMPQDAQTDFYEWVLQSQAEENIQRRAEAGL